MKIKLSAVAPRIFGSRGTPSKFVLYPLKDIYAKFGAFTRFVTIFVNFDDANGHYYEILNCYSLFNDTPQDQRSVREHFNKLLAEYKRKKNKYEKGSGITPEPPTENEKSP